MKKFVYIIASFLIVAFLLIQIELRHQKDLQQISRLTQLNEALLAENEQLEAENEMYWHNEVLLRMMIDSRDEEIEQLTKEIEHIKAQQTKEPEAQKTNRFADRPRYNLTDAERNLVERVVMAESGGESYQGQMLVCQCILNACEIDDIRPAQVIKQYAYAKSRPEPSENVKRAVTAVFDEGERVTGEPIVYFYAPALTTSEFHESQEFVLTEGGHKFFCAR
ncbi:MAG: hypothetical protein M0R74_09825 [Dehalococcoidia bacterium]|nr:hypothetical protein [Dehalococcoidia bacterium]